MKMNKMLLTGAVVFGFSIAVQAMAAADCPWQQPWIDYPGNCGNAGLNTRQGVCVPGYRYEVRCDDRRDNGKTQIKVCNGSRICYPQGNPSPPSYNPSPTPTPHHP